MAQDVYFTSNPSEFTQVEGVYVVERDPPGFVRGRNLSVMGISGACVRGPGTPQRITSTTRFLEVFGGRDRSTGAGGAVTGEVWRSLLNKRFGTLVVDRIIAVDAVIGSFNAETGIDGAGTEVLKIAASSEGAWAADVGWKIVDATDEDVGHFNLTLRYLGDQITHENLDIEAAIDDNLLEVVGDDIANWVTLTKVADGRPGNTALITETDFVAARDADGFVQLGTIGTAWNGVDGSDGTIVTADEIAAMTALAYTAGIGQLMQAGEAVDQNALNGTIVALAPLLTDRIFLTWSGVHGQAVSVEITNLATDITTRSDRIVWCYNSPYSLDPTTGLELQVPPHEWMASIFTQTDVDIHPGARANSDFLAGIRRLTNEVMTRQDLIDLKAAGISTLEKLPDNAFAFRSGVTTDLNPGLTEIARRRSADFLQLSASDRLRYYVKSKNTLENRAMMAGELVAFSNSLKDQGRIIEDFAVGTGVTTEVERAQGIEKIRWDVDLIGHMLSLVLETQIGTGVVIETA